MDIKVFSHTDLDGVGARILIQSDMEWNGGTDGDDYEHLDNATANQRIIDFVDTKEYTKFKEVYITDLPLEPTALLKLAEIGRHIRIHFIDHHITTLEKLREVGEVAMELVEESYATFIAAEKTDEPTSATLLVHDYLDMDDGREFALDVNDYDTWNWTKNGNDRAAKLNDLLYIIGIDKFVQAAIHAIDVSDETSDFLLKEYGLILELEENRINKYIESKNNEKIIVDIADIKTAVVTAEQYQSQLGHGLLKMNDDIKIVVMINPNKSVSIRSRERIDVSSLAKIYGGGGHPQASGFSVPEGTLLKLFNDIFN